MAGHSCGAQFAHGLRSLHPHIHIIRRSISQTPKHPPQALPNIFHRHPSPRSFQTSATRCARTARTNPSKPLSRTAPTSPSQYVAPRLSYQSQLASRQTPTLLYTSSASSSYAVSSFVVGTFCITYGIYNFYDIVILPHPGLWWVVPILSSGVCVAMFSLGTWVLFSGRRLVRSVFAVPVTRADGGRSLRLRVEARPFLPIPVPMERKGEIVECEVEDIQLVERIKDVVSQEAETAPKKSGPQAVFGGLTRIVSREGFAKMIVKGRQTWRLDIRAGWALDDGAALDRLLKVKE